ncbi:hypothetical protein C8J56DRAFT_1037866 [Mycena floridula]|nr:hypothetical protein C8J56DRAFT_1037866 [Mycena floridula]
MAKIVIPEDGFYAWNVFVGQSAPSLIGHRSYCFTIEARPEKNLLQRQALLPELDLEGHRGIPNIRDRLASGTLLPNSTTHSAYAAINTLPCLLLRSLSSLTPGHWLDSRTPMPVTWLATLVALYIIHWSSDSFVMDPFPSPPEAASWCSARQMFTSALWSDISDWWRLC